MWNTQTSKCKINIMLKNTFIKVLQNCTIININLQNVPYYTLVYPCVPITATVATSLAATARTAGAGTQHTVALFMVITSQILQLFN